MKKLLLLLFAVLAGFNMYAVETSYRIVFKTGSNTSNQFNSSTDIASSVTEGADYLASVKSANNSFPTTAEGIRVGSASGAGNVIFNLTTAGKVKATKIIVNAKGNKETSRLSLTSTASSTNGTKISTAGYSDYEYPLDGSELTELKLYGYARVFIASVTVFYDDGSGSGEVTTVPELPVVTFNGITAENYESYEVEKGTEVSVSSKNATTIYVNESAITGGKFTVNETGDYDIYGENAIGKGEHFLVNFTIKETPQPQPGENVTATITMNSQTDLKYGKGKNITWKSDDGLYSFSTIATITGTTYPTKSGVNLRIYNSNGNTITVNAPDGYTFVSATCVLGTAENHIAIDGKDVGSGYTFTDGATSFKLTSLKSSGNNNSDVKSMTFVMKKIQTGPATYEPEFAAIPVLFTGDTHQIIVPGDNHPAVSFTSNNPGVATVTAEGLVTAISAGTATITAEWGDSDEWVGGSATLSVTVRNPLLDPELSFRHATITGKINVGVAAQAAYHKSDGKITYTSSNPEIVTVSERTGMITPADVHAVGTATITATIAETDVYKSASASYTVVIEQPDFGPTAPAGNAQFIFTDNVNHNYGFYLFSSSTKYETTRPDAETNAPVTAITEGVVTLTFTNPENSDAGYRLWKGTKSIHMRVYENATITYSVPEGYSIEKIQLNGKSLMFESTIGEYTNDRNSGTAEWIDNSNGNYTSVSLKLKGTSNAEIETSTVVVKKAETDRIIANLSFNTRVYNTYVGEKTEINAVTSPNIGIEGGIPYSEIKYSIDNLDGNDYFVGRDNEADGKLDVTVLTPGVYTFRVNSGASDKYLRGVAILRLNVFPKVTVNAPEAQEMTNDFVVLPAEGGTIDFGELPSTLELMIKQDGDADFTAHDGSAIQITGDRTIEYHMLYAETYAHGHTTLTVVTMPVVPTVEFSGSMHTITASANAELHYSPIKEYRRKPKTAVALAAEETTWNVTTEPLNINIADYDLTDNDYIYFDTKSVKNTAVKALESPIKRMLLTNTGMLTSGVEDIEISGDSRVRFFNLNGIEADADNMTPGMYIRVSGGKAEKVIVK